MTFARSYRTHRTRLAGCILATALLLAATGARAAPAAPAEPEAAAEPRALISQVRDKASDMVLSAMNFLGVPYRRGGSSAESGFDCSGFTRHVFENTLGLVLPHRADQQAKDGALQKLGKKDELRPGDLVFFNTMKRAFSHVGIYIGEGKFIHAPRSGAEVRIEDMRQAYWSRRFNGARRPDLPMTALPIPSAEAAARLPALLPPALPPTLLALPGPPAVPALVPLEPLRQP